MRAQKSLLPLVAVGGSLVALPASALELGDVTVQSRLGQPLRASIAYALAPHEQISDTCVTLSAGASSSGLPGIGRATLSIANGSILLTGRAPIREPMVAAHIVVDCTYTANLSREYMMFIDPAEPVVNQQPAAQTPSAATSAPVVAATAASPTPAAPRRAATTRPVNTAPIGKSTRYRVNSGDSLSRIAERIENRPIGLWAAVDVIFAANPDAFMDNDPNKLKAGSWLTIPSFDGSEPVVSVGSAPVVSVGSTADRVPEARTAEVPAAQAPVAPAVDKPVDSGATIASIDPYAASRDEAQVAAPDATGDLSPADVVLDTDNPFVDVGDTATADIVIPDTELAGPTTNSSSPNVPTAIITTREQGYSSSWLVWLAGSGLAIIIGLLLFGRVFRGRPSSAPIAPAADDQPARRATDQPSGSHPTLSDGDVDDDSPTEENLELDADLVMGTGLEVGSHVDKTGDFDFGSATAVDIELPFEPESSVMAGDTDMITSVRTDENTILDSEILPDDEDYDLSVILDATKMPQPDDITERDLQAVEVSADGDTISTDSYTINGEADFEALEILERDYQDEFTATQALNVEIARAAAQLSKDVGEDTPDENTGLTVAMPPRSPAEELDPTAEMPMGGEDLVDLDATGINETATVNMTADDYTLEMPSADNDDETREMPSADNDDETRDMEHRGEKAKSKAG
ncbi:MAG: hypothetical protein KJO95_02865 [Gammaproteobacteria bacterium]|nr:hypothetical protein [Gammaproteobacteria bacterium]